jgi:hypothetical protein
MAKIRFILSTGAAAVVFMTWLGYVATRSANAADTTEKTAPAVPSKAVLVNLENSAYGAWKSKDATFWKTFLSGKFVGWGSSGRLDKVSATKEYTGAHCEIKSYALSNEQTSPLAEDAVLITHKITVDGACGGQRLAADSWAATVYVRDGDRWDGAFRAEAAIVDPKVAAAKPVGRKDLHTAANAKSTDRGARTDTMLAIEKNVWEAWRKHDAKKLAQLTAADISFINIFGVYLANKTDALKNWSGTGCDAKTVGITDAEGTMLSPTVGILTFKATADGTCYGQQVGPVWGTSIYVKAGDIWKWTFGINLPVPAEST